MIYLLSDTLERQIHPPEGSCAQSIHESAHFQTEFQFFMTSYDTMLLNKNECKHKEFCTRIQYRMTAWPWRFWQLYGASAAESSSIQLSSLEGGSARI